MTRRLRVVIELPDDATAQHLLDVCNGIDSMRVEWDIADEETNRVAVEIAGSLRAGIITSTAKLFYKD